MVDSQVFGDQSLDMHHPSIVSSICNPMPSSLIDFERIVGIRVDVPINWVGNNSGTLNCQVGFRLGIATSLYEHDNQYKFLGIPYRA